MPENDHFEELSLHADQCALAGAAAFFAGIPDAAVVINGPMWCYFYALRHIEAGLPLAAKRVVCTQLDNTSIIFGAEDYIRETLAPFANNPPALLCIENNCSASLIGDDVAGIAKDMGIRCPVVAFDSGGLSGGFAEGYIRAADAAVSALLSAIPPRVPTDIKSARPRVNLLGLTPGYLNGTNDRRELVRLLSLAGYEVNACPGAGTDTDGLRHLADTQLSIVVHEELGKLLANRLEKTCGVPYIAPPPPYGIEGTKQWLAAVNAALPSPEFSLAMAEANRTRERLLLRLNEMKSVWGDLWFDRAIVSGPYSTSLALARALREEWADVGKLTVKLMRPEPHLTPPKRGFIDDILYASSDGNDVERLLSDFRDGLVMASANESARLPSGSDALVFPIAYPVFDRIFLTHEPFMGLRGAAYIQENLWNEWMKRAR